jgi:hypothetical protein
VVDAHEQVVARAMPLFGTFARRELQDLEMVAVRVAEVERLDARPAFGFQSGRVCGSVDA